MRSYVELVSPVAPAPATATAGTVAATAGFRLAGARVSIVENTKSNAREVLDDLRTLLVERYGAAAGVAVTKPVSGPLEAHALADLVRSSDLVLVGSAD